MMPTVLLVIAASTAAGSRQKSSALMSANTGVAPVRATELAVAANVKDGTITSSPALTPLESRPRCRPEVPELTATQALPRPKCSANSASNALTSGPCASIPERSTRSTAARSSSPINGLAGGMKSVMTGQPPSGSRHREHRLAPPDGLADDKDGRLREPVAVEHAAAVDHDANPRKIGARERRVLRVIRLQHGNVRLRTQPMGREPERPQLVVGVHRVVHRDGCPFRLERTDRREDARESRLLHPAAVGGTQDYRACAGQVAVGAPG